MQTATQVAPPAPQRTWLSLLTHRWHLSSRAAAILALLFLIFCNLPGQRVLRVPNPLDSPVLSVTRWEHGWPFTWLNREFRAVPRASSPGTSQPIFGASFEIGADGAEDRWGSLAANSTLAMVLSFLAGASFEFWRRARKKIWHLHLIDAVGAMLVVSFASIWYAWTLGESKRLHESVEASTGENNGIHVEAWQEGGVSWLRDWLGEAWFEFMDRPYGVVVLDTAGWPRLAKMPTTRLVKIDCPATTDDLARLRRLPVLEAIVGWGNSGLGPSDRRRSNWQGREIRSQRSVSAEEKVAEFPRLPRVRALALGADLMNLRGLDQLPNLSRVILNQCPEQLDLASLASLPKLTHLDAYRSTLSRASWEAVGKCHGLKHIEVEYCGFRGPIVPALARLTNLESLRIGGVYIGKEDVSILAGLTKLRELKLSWAGGHKPLGFASKLSDLENLNLESTEVQPADLEALVNLKKLRTLNLLASHLDGDCLAVLKQLRQLTKLGVDGLSEEELEELQAALPDCEIVSDPFRAAASNF